MKQSGWSVLLAVGFVVALGGCMTETKEIAVNKDGSGTLTVTSGVTKQFEAMMMGMGSAMGGKANMKVTKQPIDIEKQKAKATQYGTGVTFTEAKRVKDEKGNDAVQAVYAFTDITKIHVSKDPDFDMPGAKQTKNPDSLPVTFGFQKGDVPVLTINLPHPKDPTEKAEMPDTMEEKIPSEAEQAQMKQMFSGMRIQMLVKVNGTITETDAAYTDKAAGTVTILDMNVDQMIKNPEEFKKATSLGKIKNVEEAQEKLKDIKSLRFETKEKVSVTFK